MDNNKFKSFGSLDDEEILKCLTCKHIFKVDPCGEINLWYDKKEKRLKPKCPKCEK